jgi:hypothetical protein
MYYPKSQVKTNLYSNNNYIIIATGEVYTGPYWKNSLGKLFTGITPQDLPSRELTPVVAENNAPIIINSINTSEEVYDSLIAPSYDKFLYDYLIKNPNNNISINLVPKYTSNPPTEQDYQIGEFRRYFCKKENEIIYIEISKTTYDLIIVKSPDILWQLYFPFNLSWQITGIQEQVARTNKNIIDLTSQRLRLPRFGDYLNNNYLKYYK